MFLPGGSAGLQLAAVAALLVLGAAFPAAEQPSAPAPDAAPAASEAAAQTQAIATEQDIVAEGSGTKVNKKRSQTPEVTPESVSLSPQIPDPVKKGNAVQGILLNLLQPKPILDTIREEDKYGNTGDRLSFIGRGVVAGFEGFSNILNKVLDFPFETAKKVSRSATEALNNLGSKLIGL